MRFIYLKYICKLIPVINKIMKKIKLLFCLIALLSLTNLKAQTRISELSGKQNVITSAVPFLMITPNSRAGGMGDVGVATSPDANSQHWNAAKYVHMEEEFGASISYTPWLRKLVEDINISYLTGYKKFNKNSAIAASLRYFSLGNIDFTDANGSLLKTHRPNEFALDVSYSLLFTDGFSGAVSLRFINSNLTGGISSSTTDSKAGRAIAGDISLFYTKELKLAGRKSNMAYGLNISNIGNKISYSSESSNFLPTNLRLGGALSHDFDEFNSLEFAIDVNKLLIPTPPILDEDGNPVGNVSELGPIEGIFQSFNDAPGGSKEEFREITYSFGLEYWYNKRFALRTGYFHEHATKGNRKFFTAGLGLKLNVFQLDFAYLIPTQQNNPLANTLRFSLVFDFKGLKQSSSSN